MNSIKYKVDKLSVKPGDILVFEVEAGYTHDQVRVLMSKARLLFNEAETARIPQVFIIKGSQKAYVLPSEDVGRCSKCGRFLEVTTEDLEAGK